MIFDEKFKQYMKIWRRVVIFDGNVEQETGKLMTKCRYSWKIVNKSVKIKEKVVIFVKISQ